MTSKGRGLSKPAPLEALSPPESSARAATSERARPTSVVVRPGVFLTLVIVSAVLAGGVIYWLLRSMHI